MAKKGVDARRSGFVDITSFIYFKRLPAEFFAAAAYCLDDAFLANAGLGR